MIFEIARDAGIDPRGKGEKRACRCLFHDDRNASAFVSIDNIFFCSVCTPDKGLSAKEFCLRLGLDWRRYRDSQSVTQPAKRDVSDEPIFAPRDAQETWRLACARLREDSVIPADTEHYDFLITRGLLEASEYGVFGIMPDGIALPDAVASWRRRGYGLVAPLFDLDGNIACIQSRSVRGGDPKTLAPKGGTISGTLFADERGRALLRDEAPGIHTVVFGEGLTDSLALAIASPAAVLCAPGTGNALAGIGEWARGRRVLIGLDWDDAGSRALPLVAQRAYEFGAVRVQQIEWPDRAKDACDVVSARGTAGLWEFLNRQVAA